MMMTRGTKNLLYKRDKALGLNFHHMTPLATASPGQNLLSNCFKAIPVQKSNIVNERYADDGDGTACVWAHIFGMNPRYEVPDHLTACDAAWDQEFWGNMDSFHNAVQELVDEDDRDEDLPPTQREEPPLYKIQPMFVRLFNIGPRPKLWTEPDQMFGQDLVKVGTAMKKWDETYANKIEELIAERVNMGYKKGKARPSAAAERDRGRNDALLTKLMLGWLESDGAYDIICSSPGMSIKRLCKIWYTAHSPNTTREELLQLMNVSTES